MKKKVSLSFLVLAVVLSCISFVLLPDSVVIQIGADGQPSNTLPKILAILIPLGITVAGSLLHYGSNDTSDKKGLLMAIVGIVIFVFSLVANLVFFV